MAAAQSPPEGSASVVAEQHSEAPQPPTVYSGWAERRLALDANVGLATPLGLLGVSLEYAPIRWVSLGAGVGTNLEGPQFAGMLRVRFTPNRPTSLFVGGGYSQGRFSQGLLTRYGMLSIPQGVLDAGGERPATPWRRWKRARWLNLELGGEKRSDGGFDVRGFGGVALLLNSGSNTVDKVEHVPGFETPPPVGVVPIVLYLGAAFGFSL